MRGKNPADEFAVVHALGPVTPSTSTPDYISLKDAEWVEAVIIVLNGSTVTGSAITLKQATAVAGTSEKALAFDSYKSNVDPVNSSVMTNSTAASNTFTTATTNSAKLVYRIPVDPATLDVANGFDCLRVGTGDAANTTVTAFYNVRPKYSGNSATMPNLVID